MTARAWSAYIVSPNAVDTELAIRLLAENNIRVRSFGSLAEVARALDEDASCLILVEDALVPDELPVLRDALGCLPAWCDVPLIVVAANVAAAGAAIANAFPNSGNVTLLERPVNPHSLASSIQVASRAIGRQREVGELIAAREQAVKLRDEFLAMLAHELPNPLAPMVNALYIMRRLGIEHNVLHKNLDILDRQVNHMARMIDDLLDVARLERGKVVLKKRRVDLNRVVAAAVETCLANVQLRGHKIDLRLSQRELPVNGDDVRLEQIVCNLINNAAKFTTQPGEIRVETRLETDSASIAVQDQGIGFTRDAAARLFDPFVQLNPTMARSTGGLGMGLTIVRRLTELHDGTVSAFSDGPGKGSRFVVTLPLLLGALDGAASDPGDAPSHRRLRVVVIEDNPDIRETLRALISMWGHEVHLAADGFSGLHLILRTRPEIALIDIGLPGMDGYQVASRVRADDAYTDTRLIAVTGYGQPSDKDHALHAGFDAHMLKPIRPDLLEKLLAC